MARHPSSEYRALHEAADQYERQFRALFVKSMKALQAKVSINDLALRIMQQKRQAPSLVSSRVIADAIEPAAKVLQNAIHRGSKLGVDHIQKINGQD